MCVFFDAKIHTSQHKRGIEMNYEYANATQEQLDAWDEAAHYARIEDDAWEAEQAQVRFGELGGYKAGLSRPAY